jgi:small subunit ribosomal protein S20
MANHKSAIKRHRQSLKRRDQNRSVRTHVRTLIKKLHAHVKDGDIESARALLPQAEKKIAQASAKGIYHNATAARKVSRLYQMVSKAAAIS